MNMKEYLKKKQSIEISKIYGLFTSIEDYQKICNHVWRKQEYRLQNIDETKNYLIEEVNQNE